MQLNKSIWKKLLSASLIGAFAIIPITSSISTAQAAPPKSHYDRDHRDKGHRDKGHRDKGHRDKGHRDKDHRDKDHRNKDRRDKDHDRRDRDHDRRKWDKHRRDRDKGRNDHRRRPAPGWGGGSRNNYRTFTGVVTNSRSGNKLDVRIDGKTYNVYLSGHRPRGLDRNDVVRVYGERVGSNDIRNANITILRNR